MTSAKLKINKMYLDTQISLLEEVSQQTKKPSLANLKKWVREFYTIARIVLENNPQLLESVAKFVRS